MVLSLLIEFVLKKKDLIFSLHNTFIQPYYQDPLYKTVLLNDLILLQF